MKFLLCLALCFAAAQAGLVGVPNTYAYSTPYTTYSAGIGAESAIYNTPLSYSNYPSVYSAGLNAQTVYNTAGLGLASPFVRSAFSAPTVYSAPIVANTFLKK